MTPVDATRTISSAIPSSVEAARETVSASKRPSAPVAALATPLLAITACATPERIRSMPSRTGAALKQFVVNTPAAVAGRVEKMSARSLSPFGLIPVWIPFARNPGTR